MSVEFDFAPIRAAAHIAGWRRLDVPGGDTGAPRMPHYSASEFPYHEVHVFAPHGEDHAMTEPIVTAFGRLIECTEFVARVFDNSTDNLPLVKVLYRRTNETRDDTLMFGYDFFYRTLTD